MMTEEEIKTHAVKVMARLKKDCDTVNLGILGSFKPQVVGYDKEKETFFLTDKESWEWNEQTEKIFMSEEEALIIIENLITTRIDNIRKYCELFKSDSTQRIKAYDISLPSRSNIKFNG